MRSAEENREIQAQATRNATASRVRIKICGLSRPCDIDYVNASKPDYIGFVFAKSKRQVSPLQAAELKRRLNPDIRAVGVFVNEEPERIAGLVSDGIIDWVQLHGQEDEAYIDSLRKLLARAGEETECGRNNPGVGTESVCDNSGAGEGGGCHKTAATQNACPIIKAFSIKTPEDVKNACKSSADYILLDQGAGGTGKTFDWHMIGEIGRPFFLAGGLGPDNVEAAMQTGAFALDLSSGVETDGFKDAEKIELCVRKVRNL